MEPKSIMIRRDLSSSVLLFLTFCKESKKIGIFRPCRSCRPGWPLWVLPTRLTGLKGIAVGRWGRRWISGCFSSPVNVILPGLLDLLICIMCGQCRMESTICNLHGIVANLLFLVPLRLMPHTWHAARGEIAPILAWRSAYRGRTGLSLTHKPFCWRLTGKGSY